LSSLQVDMKRKILFTVPTLCLLTCLVWLQPLSAVVASKSNKTGTIANIDFFGYGHFDSVKLRSVLPIQRGQSIDTADWSTYRSRIDEAIRSQTVSLPPTSAVTLMTAILICVRYCDWNSEPLDTTSWQWPMDDHVC
jgi:hypothetical protein